MSPRRYDDDDFDDDDYEDLARRRRDASPATTELFGPSLALLIVSGITAAILCVTLPLNALGILLPPPNQRRANDLDPKVQAALTVGIGAIQLLVNVGILGGSIMMMRGRSYGLAMTSAILAMIPGCTCCCLGIPFGVWALVVLMRPEIASAFR